MYIISEVEKEMEKIEKGAETKKKGHVEGIELQIS